MARPLRIEFPGALYHVTSRGNARAPIFLEDRDRRLILRILSDVVARYRWVCHAYCLMTNHFHLLIETPEANLSRGMRQLNGLYTQRFNRAHERVGHILQGRFGAVLVERDAHLLELARYVVLNPVRAGLVAIAEAYPWSSLRATIGLAPAPGWLSTGALLARFGSRARYLEFVHEGVGQASPWTGLRGAVLGSDAFIERLADRIDHRACETEFPRPERLVHREPIEVFFPPSVTANLPLRNHRIRELVASGRYTVAEVGRQLGLHYSTVSRIGANRPAPPSEVTIQDLTPLKS
jgi:REP element-mobilizing transposase RayT